MTGGTRRSAIGAFAIALAAAAGAAYFLAQPGIAIVAGIVAGLAVGWAFLKRGGSGNTPQLPTSNDVSTPSKLRIKPIVKLREEVVAMIDGNKSNPVISAMSFDTRSEVDSIVLRAVDLLEAKRRLQRLAAAVFPSRAAVKGLEEKLARTQDEAAKASVQQALETRREELRILEELEAESHRLDANLDEAEAALAELRTRLLKVVASSSEQQAVEEMDPLSGMTERLHRISSTMEESVEMVTTRIGDNEPSL